MSMPEGVSAKFGTYMLACRELLSHLSALRLATVGDNRLSDTDCIKRFDEVMHDFFSRSTVNDSSKAAERFCDRLDVESRDIRDVNGEAAKIFDEIVADIASKAPNWDHIADLESFHANGRELAQLFFSDSTSRVTQGRLSNVCNLEVEYVTSSETRDACAESFGFRLAPIACHSYQTEQGHSATNIKVRFNFTHDFSSYLSYTFLFLHEYTAHIYSTDYGNERFNDGWMLHAASSFLFQTQRSRKKQIIVDDQIGIFEARLRGFLNPIPRRASGFAGEFERIICKKFPERFVQITHQLSEFEPKNLESASWPNQFINALENEFLKNREKLTEMVGESIDIRELMNRLHFRS